MTSTIVSSVSIEEEPALSVSATTNTTTTTMTTNFKDSDSKTTSITTTTTKNIEEDKYSMTLKELRSSGYIEELCEKYGMSLYVFDTISTIESSYGKHCQKGNAWGWNTGEGYKSLANNWYDASEVFIKKFIESPYYNKGWPKDKHMRTYCPSGAYDGYFG